jgi:hypothetical protein
VEGSGPLDTSERVGRCSENSLPPVNSSPLPPHPPPPQLAAMTLTHNKRKLGWGRGGDSRNLQNNNAATGGRKGVRDVGEREERGVKIIVRHSPHSSCMLFCFLLPTMNRPVWMGGGECVRLLYNFPDQKCNSSKI